MDDLASRLMLRDFDDGVVGTLEKLLAQRIDEIESLGLNSDIDVERDVLVESDAVDVDFEDGELEKLEADCGKDHPLPSLLMFGGATHSTHPVEFQLIVTRSVHLAIGLAAMGDSHHDDIVMGCRRAWRLKEREEEFKPLMPLLPDFGQPFDAIADELQTLSESEDPVIQKFADRLGRWARVIRVLVEGRDKHTVTSPGSRLRLPGRVTAMESQEFPDVVVSIAESPIETAYPNAPEEAQHDRAKGGSPAYIQPKTTSRDRADGIGYLRGQQIINRLHMESACPTALHSRLTKNEGCWAFAKAYRLAETSSGYLFTALAILTGRRVERLLALDVVNDTLDNTQTEYWFQRNGVVALWYRPTLPRFDALMKLGILEQSNDEGIALPMPPKLGKLLLAHLKKRRPPTVTKDAADAVSQIAGDTDKRVTAVRLSKFMGQRLTAIDIDEVDVAWLSGISAGHRAGLYYSVIPRERLIHTYYEYVDEVMAGVSDADQWNDRPPLPGGVVGSRIRVKPEHVTRLFNLQADALDAARQHQAAVDIRVFHNRYVLYTFQLLAFACSIRAITEPFGCMDDINIAAGTLRLSDKANRNDISDRLIPMGEIARAQIKAYNLHLRQLHRAFRDVRPAVAENIDGALNGGFSWLFRFDHKHRIHTVRPRWILRELKDTWPLPINWPRHFHSSWLREAGFGRGVIRAYLGHADSGAAPLSRFDGTSVFELKQLANAVNSKIASLNIGVTNGWNTRI